MKQRTPKRNLCTTVGNKISAAGSTFPDFDEPSEERLEAIYSGEPPIPPQEACELALRDKD